MKETELTVDEAPPRRSSTALLSPEDAAAAGVEPGKQPPAGANKVQRGDTILTMTWCFSHSLLLRFSLSSFLTMREIAACDKVF